MVIIMLNLLIAIMGDSYDRVQAKEEVEGLMERAKIICRMETVSSKGMFPLAVGQLVG